MASQTSLTTKQQEGAAVSFSSPTIYDVLRVLVYWCTGVLVYWCTGVWHQMEHACTSTLSILLFSISCSCPCVHRIRGLCHTSCLTTFVSRLQRNRVLITARNTTHLQPGDKGFFWYKRFSAQSIICSLVVGVLCFLLY